MTANSPSSFAESASSTIDPDARARRGNDGELSAVFQSDLTIDGDAVDGVLTAEECAAEFDENLDDGKLYAEVRIGRFAELIATAVVAGYRDEQKQQLLAEGPQRSNLIDALLEGRAFDEWSLRDAASKLRLPINGPFVVIAAQVPIVGDEPLPEIESKLRSLDMFSSWRLQPDVQVGIVHVTSDQKLDRIVALLSRMTTARVGISAAFEDLRDTPRALHVARVMLRGPTDSTSSVAVFDGSILATAAVSAPEAMTKTVGAVLDGFGHLPDEDRKMLFETFRVWQDNDASARGAAEVLICHPNTVRHRLRRIEKHTGRSFSRPRDVAELCLAFEVHRRLM
jgi:sugar diacid utilization regulator